MGAPGEPHAVRFGYEWNDEAGDRFRGYGNEDREFDENGCKREHTASINDLHIKEGDRKS